jgi:hypothetical protein
MLLIYQDEQILSDDYREACYTESRAIAHDLSEKGRLLGTSPLYPTQTATSIRIRDGKRMVTDGPFAETREQLGGYYLIDVPDLDEAIDVASRIPGARNGTVEVRPVIELSGLPKDT